MIQAVITTLMLCCCCFTVSWSLLKLMSIELVMLSNYLILCRPFSSHLQSFPALGSFPMSWFIASGGQSIGTSTSASILPMNIQDRFLLGLTDLISSSTTILKHQFFRVQPSLWSSFHIHTWLQEKPSLWLYIPLSAKWCLYFLIPYLALS